MFLLGSLQQEAGHILLVPVIRLKRGLVCR